MKDQISEFKIGDILVKPSHNQIVFNNEVVLLEPLAMALLVQLAQHHGEVVYREQLMEQLWQARVVTENALHRIVTLLRKALNDNSKDPQYIKTVSKKGYKLIHPVEWLEYQPVQLKGAKKYSRVTTVIITTILLIGLSISFFSNNSPSYYRLSDIQQVTSFTGVEAYGEFLPIEDNTKPSFIFTYENRQRTHNKIAMKYFGDDNVYDLTADAFDYRQLSVSPKGHWLTFIKTDDKNCQLVLAEFLVNEQKIVKQNDIANCAYFSSATPQWLKSEEQFFFLKTDNSYFNSQIMRFNLNSREITPLFVKPPINSDDYFISGDSNGNRLAYARYWPDKLEIRVYDDTSDQDRLIRTFEEPVISDLIWFEGEEDTLLVSYQGQSKLLTLDGKLIDINIENQQTGFHISSNKQSDLLLSKTEHLIQILEYQHAEQQLSYIQAIAPSSANEYRGVYVQDNKTIAYFSDKESEHYKLWLLNDDEEKALDIGIEHSAGVLVQSPQDSDLFLLKTHEEQLFSFHIKSKKLTYLTEKDEYVKRGVWHPNKAVIFYVKENNKLFNIYQKDLATGQISQVTFNGANFLQVSSDGRFLYYNANDQAGLWRLALDSGDNQLVIADFKEENFANWQVFEDGVYFTRTSDGQSGLFFYHFASQKQNTLMADTKIYHFDVSAKQDKILISLIEKFEADLYHAVLSKN